MKRAEGAARAAASVAISGLVLLGLASCATPSLQSANLGKTRPTKLGMVLVDSDGDTLYTYDPDSRGESKCTGTCAIVWPPVEAGSEARPTDGFSIITRPNGSRQWAYKGEPLYGYIFDNGPGSVSGDGEDGVWHVARP